MLSLRRTLEFAAYGAIAGLLPATSLLAATPIQGAFALENVAPGVGAEMTAVPQGTPLNIRLDIMLHRLGEPNAMKKYETINDEQMHVLTVSDDFQSIAERHIEHMIDGHGQAWIRFPKTGLYHVFATATPKTLPLQIMRFDLKLGDDEVAATHLPQKSPVAEVHTGPYLARFDTLAIPEGVAATLNLHLTEMGKPAKDIHSSNGLAATAIMISTDDLHVVPVKLVEESPSPAGVPISPDIAFNIDGASPGTYRLVVSFSGGRTAYIAPFVATVR